MIEQNKKAFDRFKALHDKYALDQEVYQDEFNQEGEKILAITREWENKLCMQSEKAGYGNYTTGLSEKFQAEIRHHFPMIDHIGIIVKKDRPFALKKINL